MRVTSSQEAGGEFGVWLLVTTLKSAVFSFRTTVRATRLLLRCGPCLLSEPPYCGLCFRQQDVLLKGIFGDWVGRLGTTGFSSIPSRQAIEPCSVSSEEGYELLAIPAPEIAHRAYPDSIQLLFHDLARAWDAADGQRREKALHFSRLNDKQAIRLSLVRRDLGRELVGRDARRCR